MTQSAPFPHVVPPETDSAMPEEREEKWSGVERRESKTPSPFANPMMYIGACAVMLTICSLLLTIALNVLSGINARLTTIDTNTQATMLGMAKQGESIETLKRDIVQLQNAKETQEQINRVFGEKLAKVEAKEK
jgi:hypothetical protein